MEVRDASKYRGDNNVVTSPSMYRMGIPSASESKNGMLSPAVPLVADCPTAPRCSIRKQTATVSSTRRQLTSVRTRVER
ncbi:hypothetical protein DPMN_188264 [Dreissena polymorpha]|uniref:Uncharacterized protein n=1 Tax=Dreissena polymorpha TaxID=45954 RepID=A0A9D4I9V6_DREPO|nr:hypothetical protein DPMN_188264 [Dreissena polymorpha]